MFSVQIFVLVVLTFYPLPNFSGYSLSVQMPLENEERDCAALFNFNGDRILFKDTDSSQDASKDYFATLGDPLKWVTNYAQVELFCRLKLCNETEYSGTCQTLTGGNHSFADISVSNIESLYCTCTKEFPYTSDPPISNLVNVPETMPGVMKMLLDTNGQHAGLTVAHRSLYKQMSAKNAYILIIRTAGVDKTTINRIFNNASILTDHMNSGIRKYHIPVPIDQLGVSNSQLKIVTTPSLDWTTGGINQTAKVLATLDEFLSAHEELRDKIPNAALIFIDMPKKGFEYVDSSVYNIISGLNTLQNRLTDREMYNVIFVLTNSSFYDSPRQSLYEFQNFIEKHSLFPNAISILADANFPSNLYECLAKTEENMGYWIFQRVFPNIKEFNPVSVSDFPLVDSPTGKARYYERLLTSRYNETQLSKSFKNVCNNDTECFQAVDDLQKALFIQNIQTTQKIPKEAKEMQQLLMSVFRSATSSEKELLLVLNKTLRVQPPTFPNISLIGSGYNLVDKRVLPVSPFRETGNYFQDGFMIPNRLPIVKKISVTNVMMENNATCNFSAVKEFHRFFIGGETTGWRRIIPKLSNEFKGDVEALPVFREDGAGEYERFFEKYGTHVVDSGVAGGYMQVTVESGSLCGNGTVLANVVKEMAEFPDRVAVTMILRGNLGREAYNGTVGSVWSNDTVFTLSTHGGFPSYDEVDITHNQVEDVQRMFREWKQSLEYYPAMLSLSLKPVYELVDGNYSEELRKGVGWSLEVGGVVQERIVTDKEDIKNGVRIDYRYNQSTFPREPAIGLQSAPGCPKSSEDGFPWVYYGGVGGEQMCFLAGERGPCGIQQVFAVEMGSDVGYCDCDCGLSWDDKWGEERRCPTIFDKKDLVYLARYKQCFMLYEQGPCQDDEWLVGRSENSDEGVEELGHCEKRECSDGQVPYVKWDGSRFCREPWEMHSSLAQMTPNQCKAKGRKYSSFLQTCTKRIWNTFL